MRPRITLDGAASERHGPRWISLRPLPLAAAPDGSPKEETERASSFETEGDISIRR